MTRIPTTLSALAALAVLTVAPSPAAEAFEPVMEPYHEIHQALAADTLDGVPAAAKSLADRLRGLEESLTADRAGVEPDELAKVKQQVGTAAEAAEALAKAEDLEAARARFGDLSEALVAWRDLAGTGPAVGYCPMVEKHWLETDTETLENPYYGASMLRCGTFRAR